MSNKIIINMAIERKQVFENLYEYIKKIKKIVKNIDENAEIYLFGSVPEKNFNYSSDIDVLIITESNPDELRLKLWKANIKEPFELHIHTPENSKRIRAKLMKI